MIINQQPVNLDTEFTFGVELECIEFYNGEPLDVEATSRVKNLETGIIYIACLDMTETVTLSEERIKELKKVQITGADHSMTKESIGCEFQSSEFFSLPLEVQEAWKISNPIDIPIDSNGKLILPWVEVSDRSYLECPSDKSSIGQAQTLLQEQKLKGWKVDYDSSLTNAGVSGIELVSPILKDGEFDQIRKVCNTFRNLVKIDKTCGLHIHIGMNKPFEAEHLKKLVQRWLEIEPAIIWHPAYQEMGTQNDFLSKQADMKKIDQVTTVLETIVAVNGSSRNCPINLHSLHKHRTIEFRGFRSTLDSAQIKLIVRFCLWMVRMAII